MACHGIEQSSQRRRRVAGRVDPGTRRVHLFWQPTAPVASVALAADLPIRVFEVGLEVKEKAPVNGRYALPTGYVVISVENGRVGPAAYTLHVA